MAQDPCALAKNAVRKASSPEGKGCDEYNHPLSGVTDDGKVLGSVTTLTCEHCKTVIDLIRKELKPVNMTTGDGDEIVEFRVVPRRVLVSTTAGRALGTVGVGGRFPGARRSYTYNAKGMFGRPLFPSWL